MADEAKENLIQKTRFSSTLHSGNLTTTKNTNPQQGDRWIYSAGFNVDASLNDTKRIDVEISDIKFLAESGARLAILSHQGSWRERTACHLDFIADYLSNRLAINVGYFPENNSDAAIERANSMQNGDVVIFGNTRFNEGEEQGDLKLARQFAQLGDYVAVGGFSKAHRAHSSNVGILRFLPGYATTGLLHEIKMLDDLMRPSLQTKSIAVIGGTKVEKITKGLKLFRGIYNFIIPGGIVLNNILKARGVHIGASYLGEDPCITTAATKEILSSDGQACLLLPNDLIVARKDSEDIYHNCKIININDGVPKDYMIVDFILNAEAKTAFSNSNGLNVRAVIAGTPCLTKDGFTSASNELLNLISSNNVATFMMGGNTLEDLPFDCASSTGGGAALYYLAEKTCPVLEALAHNQTNPR